MFIKLLKLSLAGAPERWLVLPGEGHHYLLTDGEKFQGGVRPTNSPDWPNGFHGG